MMTTSTRKILYTATCLLLSLLLANHTVAEEPKGILSKSKPLNFINIVVDDMGYSDIGCMGGPVETPHMDKLARSGILFTNYRTYAKCSPTRDATEEENRKEKQEVIS